MRNGNMANIKVAIRVRPMSARELNLTGSEVVVHTETNEISLTNLKVSSSKVGDSRRRTRRYGFDYCFDSSDPEAKNYSNQATIYETLGQSILDVIFNGYNFCLVAYGQSASGKTYTMMGTKEDPGLIPRLCEGLFSRVKEEDKQEEMIYRVTVRYWGLQIDSLIAGGEIPVRYEEAGVASVSIFTHTNNPSSRPISVFAQFGEGGRHSKTLSYLEIYNERVRDLLKPTESKSGLRVREHPRLGPYVQGLTHHVVRTLGSLMSYVEEGAKARKTASTHQNPSSSRSHALLTVALSQETTNNTDHSGNGASFSRKQYTTLRSGGSKLHLVDLAGSENAATCGGVHRLKEGANINKSLVALGNVISALVERGSIGSKTSKRYVPYRDSSLTWLLKDALGGNATTIMLATISPASGSYNETAHTLRFAQRAQSVVNRPVVNEDSVARLIRELRAEISRLKSLLLQKDIDQQQNKVPCCCGKVQSSGDVVTSDLQYREEQKSLNISIVCTPKDEFIKLKDKCDVLQIRRFNSIDSVKTYEADTTGSIRKFNSYEHLQSQNNCYIGNYNRAKITELNDEEDEVVEDIKEPVFVDIPTLVAVLIKPDDSLHDSSTQIEEISSDEVQEDAIDVDFIESSNQIFEKVEQVNILGSDNRRNSVNSCDTVETSRVEELQQIPLECTSGSSVTVERSRVRKGKLNKQKSVDLPLSNLDISKQFSSVEGINGRREPIFSLQRSHTSVDRRSALPDRVKKLNNISEINNRKVNTKSGSIKAIDNIGSKIYHRRKNSNDSDRSLRDSNNSKTSSYSSIGRKPSLESLKRKTSKDSSSSSSKDEQILISGLARDKLLHKKNFSDQQAIGSKNHTAIQRATRAEIVAAVTERLYSSRKPIEETNMTTNASGARSPPEGANEMKMPTTVSVARARLQEISRKMLLKRRRISVETQTQMASTVRLKDTASLTDEPKVILQDAAVLTDEHHHCDVFVTDHRIPVLRVKDVTTLTDRPRTKIYHCKDVECLANDLDFDDYELHSLPNDSGILSDDTQNYAESNLSSAEISEHCPERDRRILYTDSSTNTYSSGRTTAVQTLGQEIIDHRRDIRCRQYCSLIHESCHRIPANSPEKNIISISLPDMINITIESVNGIESKIAVTDGVDSVQEKPKIIFSDKEIQTEEQVKSETEDYFSKNPSVRSMAIQADGRVFRIENIFHDPRSKSYTDVASNLEKETTMKRSVTFRNSLGTSSVIEAKENSADINWNRTDIDSCYQRKNSVLKDNLIQTFFSRRYAYNLNPRRPTIYEFVYHNFWKNWTLPSSRLVDYNKEMITVLAPLQLKTDTGIIDNLPFSTTSNKHIPVDKISEEVTCECLNQISTDNLNRLPDYDYNFSDDSLDDENKITRKTIKKEMTDTYNRENYKNPCPPDVVAQTKKEASKTMDQIDSVNHILDNDFEDTEIELPKTKLAETSHSDTTRDYKSLILGVSSYIDVPEKETIIDMSNLPESAGRKKVSFSSLSNSKEINDNNQNFLSKLNSKIASRSIIKKKKKTKNLAGRLDTVQSNFESHGSLREREKKSTGRSEISLTLKENQYLKELLNDTKAKRSFDDNYLEESYSDLDDVISDNDTGVNTTSRRNILEEYLSETVTFMRNMNSINEYMNAIRMLDCHGKRRKRRRIRRMNNCSGDKDYVELRKCKISVKDDIDKYLKSHKNEIIPIESYEKCLKSIEQLEDCINKINKHNQVLCDKYGIDVESASAKLGLARPSLDFKMPATTDNNINQYDDTVCQSFFNESNSSKTFVTFPSSTQADITKPSTWNEKETYSAISEIDGDESDKKNNNVTTEDDLERRIFDQLMDVADSNRYWSMRKLRQRRFWRMRDLRLRDSMIYPKYQDTSYQDTSKTSNFDALSTFDYYLDNVCGIENNSQDFRKLKLLRQIEDTNLFESSMYPEEFSERVKLSKGNGNLSEIEVLDDSMNLELEDFNYLIDPMKSIETEATSHEESEITRSNTDSMENLKIDSMNPNFRGLFSIELRYPGSPRAKFLELLRERRRIVENTRGTNAF